MADFCVQCAKELGFEKTDLAGLSRPMDDADRMYPLVICEGCGPIQVDSKGNCVSEDCLMMGHKEEK